MKAEILHWFKQNYTSLYEEMKKCSHTHSNGSMNPYHLEESVLEHTMMVLDLVVDDRNHIFAAFLHDIGKVHTRNEKKSGKVSFFNHENVSMVKSIDILHNASKSFNIDVLFILKLIAWHGTLWNKTPVSTKLKSIDSCYGHQFEFFKHLLMFTEADAYGRDFDNSVKDELDFLDDQFKHLDIYIPFNTQTYRKEKPLNATFLIGLSGSGKSTLISNLDKTNTEVISIDSFFENKNRNYDYIDYKKTINKAFTKSIKDLENAVSNQKNIIVDMTNLTKKTRSTKLKRIPITKYNQKAIVLLTGEEKIKFNLKNRSGKHLNDDIINKQICDFELPNYDEFDDIEYKLIF